jgi:hypothetical protein
MAITLLSDSGDQAGEITSAGIGTALAYPNIVITAVADSGGNLKLISWKVVDDGKTISRLGHFGPQAGAVDLLDIAGAWGNLFITSNTYDNIRLFRSRHSIDSKRWTWCGLSQPQSGTVCRPPIRIVPMI